VAYQALIQGWELRSAFGASSGPLRGQRSPQESMLPAKHIKRDWGGGQRDKEVTQPFRFTGQLT